MQARLATTEANSTTAVEETSRRLSAAGRAVVSQVRRREARELLTPGHDRTQRMRGFDDEFTDIVDYIYRITHRIWVERAIGLIYRYYDEACTIYSPYGVTRSAEEVVGATAAMINAFPDRESHFLNVAWSGDDEQSFYTSHLGFSRMTNRGPTVFGPATGRRVLVRTAADCLSRNNKIHTEWLVRDGGALVRQMGLDRHAVARRLADRAAAAGSAPTPARSAQRREPLPLGREAPEQLVAHLLHDVWNLRRLDMLERACAPGVIAHSGGGRVVLGVHNLSALIVSMLASIPDASLTLEHTCYSEERDGLIVAARWTLAGTTRAGGLLGEVPAGRPVSLMGISHFRFLGGAIVEEWTVYDEVAALAQVYRGSPSSSTPTGGDSLLSGQPGSVSDRGEA